MDADIFRAIKFKLFLNIVINNYLFTWQTLYLPAFRRKESFLIFSVHFLHVALITDLSLRLAMANPLHINATICRLARKRVPFIWPNKSQPTLIHLYAGPLKIKNNPSQYSFERVKLQYFLLVSKLSRNLYCAPFWKIYQKIEFDHAISYFKRYRLSLDYLSKRIATGQRLFTPDCTNHKLSVIHKAPKFFFLDTECTSCIRTLKCHAIAFFSMNHTSADNVIVTSLLFHAVYLISSQFR